MKSKNMFLPVVEHAVAFDRRSPDSQIIRLCACSSSLPSSRSLHHRLSMDLVNCLSAVTTGLCLVLKLPQIRAVMQSGSTRGLSQSSIMLEFWRSVSSCLLFHTH